MRVHQSCVHARMLPILLRVGPNELALSFDPQQKVKSLKETIQKIIPSREQRLFYHGGELTNEKTLASYEIKEDPICLAFDAQEDEIESMLNSRIVKPKRVLVEVLPAGPGYACWMPVTLKESQTIGDAVKSLNLPQLDRQVMFRETLLDLSTTFAQHEQIVDLDLLRLQLPQYERMSMLEWSQMLAAGRHVPGCGSHVASIARDALGLLSTVCQIQERQPKKARLPQTTLVSNAQTEVGVLLQHDSVHLDRYLISKALKLTERQDAEMKTLTDIPLSVARTTLAVMDVALLLYENGPNHIYGDRVTAVTMLLAATDSALLLAEANSQQDVMGDLRADWRAKCAHFDTLKPQVLAEKKNKDALIKKKTAEKKEGQEKGSGRRAHA